MQFSVVIAIFASVAFALPAQEVGNTRRDGLCPGGLLYSVPQCCSTDVLGVADLSCGSPTETPTDSGSFTSICAGEGKAPKCCSIPVAGLAVLCTDAA